MFLSGKAITIYPRRSTCKVKWRMSGEGTRVRPSSRDDPLYGFVLGGSVSYGQSIHRSIDGDPLVSPLHAGDVCVIHLPLLLAPEKIKGKTRKLIRRNEPEKEPQEYAPPFCRVFISTGCRGRLGCQCPPPSSCWDQRRRVDALLARKVKDLALGLTIAAILALTRRVSYFIVALAVVSVSTARDIEYCSKAAKRRENYRFYYPSAVSSLYILLESGLTFDRALRMVARVTLTGRNPDDPVATDLNKAVIHLETGYDSVMAASWLAERCPLPEVQAAIRLMARYEREGGREILELIRMQADRGRQLFRDAMRGRAEQRSLLFVFPMAVDLLVVMATVILPAVTQMGIVL